MEKKICHTCKKEAKNGERFEVIRNQYRCHACEVRANNRHFYDTEEAHAESDDRKNDDEKIQ